MDEMVIMGFDFKSLKFEIMNSSSFPSLSQKKKHGEGILDPVACFFFERTLLERETSLSKYTRSNRWRSSEREGKTFYAEQATRGLRD